MSGASLKMAREKAGWTQVRLSQQLGVTQAYLSLMERGRKPVTTRLARAVARVLDLPATELPLGGPPRATAKTDNDAVADALARLDYPPFAHRKRGRAIRNPAEVLLQALALDPLEARLAEALPWLLLRFVHLDLGWLTEQAKLADLQNRLGFTVALARQAAERVPEYTHRLPHLRELEGSLERSRLVREDTFGASRMTDRMRAWLRAHRPEAARHWNLLTDLKVEHLPYVAEHP